MSPNKVIFANPHCSDDDIKQLVELKVNKFTVDSESQIRNILEICSPQILLRLCPDSQNEQEVKLGTKFGATFFEAYRLVRLLKELNGNLTGFCFHMGYPIGSPVEIEKLLVHMKQLNALCNELNFQIKLIDVGGGFVSESHNYEHKLEDYAKVFAQISEEFPGAEICSEPGRYFVEDCMDFFTKVDSVEPSVQVLGSSINWFLRNKVF